MSKEIVIITGGASRTRLRTCKTIYQKELFCCNIDRAFEKMKVLNNTYKDNYKGFIGDISDNEFVKMLLMKYQI